jgi:hypothetical protein
LIAAARYAALLADPMAAKMIRATSPKLGKAPFLCLGLRPVRKTRPALSWDLGAQYAVHHRWRARQVSRVTFEGEIRLVANRRARCRLVLPVDSWFDARRCAAVAAGD